jgi:hypothetical protein
MKKVTLNSLTEDLNYVINKFSTNPVFGFDDVVYDELDAVCKDYLIFRGYRVSDKVKEKPITTRLDDLPSYFYNILRHRYPKVLCSEDKTRDRVVAKHFLASRQKNGVNKKVAFQECMDIIDSFFDNMEEFQLKPPVGFTIFGQGKAVWITNKAVELLYKKTEAKHIDKLNECIDRSGELDNDDMGISLD